MKKDKGNRIRYRFRNGAGAYLCLLVIEGDTVYLGFTDRYTQAVTVRDVNATRHIKELAALGGEPLVPDPYLVGPNSGYSKR